MQNHLFNRRLFGSNGIYAHKHNTFIIQVVLLSWHNNFELKAIHYQNNSFHRFIENLLKNYTIHYYNVIL